MALCFASYLEVDKINILRGHYPSIKRMGTTKITGWTYDNINNTIVPCANGTVNVTLYKVQIDDTLQLDDDYNYPAVYTKIPIYTMRNKKRYEAFTYVKNPDFIITPHLTLSEKYRLQEAYSEAGVDVLYWPRYIF